MIARLVTPTGAGRTEVGPNRVASRYGRWSARSSPGLGERLTIATQRQGWASSPVAKQEPGMGVETFLGSCRTRPERWRVGAWETDQMT